MIKTKSAVFYDNIKLWKDQSCVKSTFTFNSVSSADNILNQDLIGTSVVSDCGSSTFTSVQDLRTLLRIDKSKSNSICETKQNRETVITPAPFDQHKGRCERWVEACLDTSVMGRGTLQLCGTSSRHVLPPPTGDHWKQQLPHTGDHVSLRNEPTEPRIMSSEGQHLHRGRFNL